MSSAFSAASINVSRSARLIVTVSGVSASSLSIDLPPVSDPGDHHAGALDDEDRPPIAFPPPPAETALPPPRIMVHKSVHIFRKHPPVAHVSFTALRQNMASYFDRVTDDREPLLVTRQGGRGNVVILSEEEFAGWQETVHLLSSPKNAARLLASIRELDAGQGHSHDLMEDGGPEAA